MAQLGIGEVALLYIFIMVLAFKLLSWPVAIASFIGAVTLGVFRLKHRYGYWKRVGVPGPEPSLFSGNDGDVGKGFHILDEEWTKTYGETYGAYIFGNADLTTANLDILKQVMIKDFHAFPDRVSPFGLGAKSEYDDNLMGHSIVNLTGEHWKNVRAQVSPVFTTGKIKEMIPVFDECARTTCQLLGEAADKGGEFNLKTFTDKLSMDMIGRIGFGKDFHVQTDPDSEFVKMTQMALNFSMSDPVVILYLLFPNIMETIQTRLHVTLLFHKANKYMHKHLTRMLEKRMAEQAQNDEEEEAGKREMTAEDKEVLNEDVFAKRKNKKILSRMAFVFLIAGYDNTSTALALMLYLLAQFPEIQDKVRKEIDEVVGQDTTVSADQMANLTYTQQVLDETLRIYPATPRVTRTVRESITVSGIPLRVGDTFSVPIRMVHHDPRNYPDPHKFDPDRFSPDEKARRDPMTYMPFGLGPRNCIAMRMVFYQVRVAVAHIVKNFNLELGPNSPDLPIRFTSAGPVKLIDQPIVVLKRRQLAY